MATAGGETEFEVQATVTDEWVVKQLDHADGYLSTIGPWGTLGSARWFNTEQDTQAAAVTECPAGAALHIHMAGPPSR